MLVLSSGSGSRVLIGIQKCTGQFSITMNYTVKKFSRCLGKRACFTETGGLQQEYHLEASPHGGLHGSCKRTLECKLAALLITWNSQSPHTTEEAGPDENTSFAFMEKQG